MLAFRLFFGRSIEPHGEVTDSTWQEFAKRVITPNLPDGYTVFDATGAWLDPASRRTIHEATKVLEVALPDAPASANAITRIRQAYRQLFHQQQVGMMVAPVCGAF